MSGEIHREHSLAQDVPTNQHLRDYALAWSGEGGKFMYNKVIDHK